MMLADSDIDAKGKRNDSHTFLERPVQKLILLLESETKEIPVEEP